LTAALSERTVVVASASQTSTRVEGEVVILDLSGGAYYGLNAVGARIWELMREPKTLRDIRDRIVDEFDVDPQRCERDLVALVGELLDRRLAEVVGSAKPHATSIQEETGGTRRGEDPAEHGRRSSVRRGGDRPRDV
jgi:hypothetical protein